MARVSKGGARMDLPHRFLDLCCSDSKGMLLVHTVGTSQARDGHAGGFALKAADWILIDRTQVEAESHVGFAPLLRRYAQVC